MMSDSIRVDPPAPPYSIGSSHLPGLSKLTEECGELTQVLGKVLGMGSAGDHWDGTNLRKRLIEEMGMCTRPSFSLPATSHWPKRKPCGIAWKTSWPRSASGTRIKAARDA